MKGNSIHYAWVILAGSTFIIFYSIGICYDLMSVFLAALETEIGMNKTETSANMSILMFASALSMLMAGHLYNKIGIRRMNFIYMSLMSGSFIIFSISGSTIICYMAALLTGLGYGGGSMIPASLLLNNWFEKKRGMVTGIAFSSSGIAMIILPVIVGKIIDLYGVESALRITALLIFIMGLVVALIIRDEPKEKACLPYGSEGFSIDGKVSHDLQKGKGIGLLRTVKFYKLMCTMLLLGVVMTPMISLLPSFLCSAGYSLEYSTYIMSAFGITMILGKIFYGVLIDKIGNYATNYYGHGVLIAALIFGVLIGKLSIAPLAIGCLLGLGVSTSSVAPPIWVSDLFDKSVYAEGFSMVSFAFALGSSLGLIGYGILTDVTGNFRIPYAISIVIIVVACVLVQSVYRSKSKVLKERI